jgi:hypothetical protein
MLSKMTGHTGKSPCRACEVVGTLQGGHNYVVLNPPTPAPKDGPGPYDPAALPLRTHETILRQSAEVESATNRAKTARDTGVTGASILAQVPGIDMVQSFGIEFMHLMFENIVKVSHTDIF